MNPLMSVTARSNSLPGCPNLPDDQYLHNSETIEDRPQNMLSFLSTLDSYANPVASSALIRYEAMWDPFVRSKELRGWRVRKRYILGPNPFSGVFWDFKYRGSSHPQQRRFIYVGETSCVAGARLQAMSGPATRIITYPQR